MNCIPSIHNVINIVPFVHFIHFFFRFLGSVINFEYRIICQCLHTETELLSFKIHNTEYKMVEQKIKVFFEIINSIINYSSRQPTMITFYLDSPNTIPIRNKFILRSNKLFVLHKLYY